MSELVSITPHADDATADDGYDSPPPSEDWNDECDEAASFLDHRRQWLSVMDELVHIQPFMEAAHQANTRRPTTLLDRRGGSLPPLPLNRRRCLLPVFNAVVG